MAVRAWRQARCDRVRLVQPQERALCAGMDGARPPIVLAHGFLGFESLKLGPFQLSYFGPVAALLRAQGHTRILAPTVPPTGSVHRRAERLLEAIHQWDERRSGERVVLIGHSMGGLDARYLCSRLGGDSLVSTVMTVGTPHRGSMLSDLNLHAARAMGLEKALLTLTQRQKTFWTRLLHGLPASGQVLTRAGAAEFNDSTPDAADVLYYSIGGDRGSTKRTTPSLKLFHLYMRATEGANDGLVSVQSARWGEDLGVMDADHMQQVSSRLVGCPFHFFGSVLLFRWSHAPPPHPHAMWACHRWA